MLVFQPPLNKPAQIKLRAILWCLWNGKDLPVSLPPEGIVSFPIANIENLDPEFYQLIGYPVFGPKAIRIDMLDRVVVDIYEQAENWEFRAKHQYAEWLGSNLEDLYKILEAMGHQLIEDVNAEKKENEEELIRDEEGKPLLAKFKLRRGKMSKEAKGISSKTHSKSKKPAPKPQKKKQHKKPPRKPSVVHAAAKGQEQDNPFAILQQLKENG